MSFFQFDENFWQFQAQFPPAQPTAYFPNVGADEAEAPEAPDWTAQLRTNPVCRRKYKLWEETQGMCIYCGKSIAPGDFINGIDSDIEHILPHALGGQSFLSNLACSCRECNRAKGDLAAMDFMLSQSPQRLQDYLKRLRFLIAAGSLSEEKYLNLTRPAMLGPKTKTMADRSAIHNRMVPMTCPLLKNIKNQDQ
ncbi:MAG: HNH endonuclease [Bacteroidales bacterium]|nr:HNH endonuclease [Bacteroidales bacterium]